MSDDAHRRGEAKPAPLTSSVASSTSSAVASSADSKGVSASASPSAESAGLTGASVTASGAPLQSAEVAQVTPMRASASPAAAKELPKDVVLIGPPTADGAGLHVIRARDERLEAGELRALEEGKPIVGEIVTLKPRQENPRVCDVTDSYAPPITAQAAPADSQLAHKGPAKVASPAYREGWDEIFGAKKKTPPPSSLN